jgi:hypothetical protein
MANRDFQCFNLVLVQMKWLPVRGSKDACRFFEQCAPPNQFVNRIGSHVGRTHLEQKVGPQPPLIDKRALDIVACAVIRDKEKRSNKIPIIGKNLGVKIKNAH